VRDSSIGDGARKKRFIGMKLVTNDDYTAFVGSNKSISVENKEIEFLNGCRLDRLQPDEFDLEATTVWSFPNRGKWATHRGDYRGNWAPEIPRNLILRYTEPGDVVLDAMCGSGTTLVECKLLGRNGIGVDININAVMLTLDRLNFKPANMFEEIPHTSIRLYQGDARNLNEIEDESIDLIATHPPYANIISYSRRKEMDDTSDLSFVSDIGEFIQNMRLVAEEAYRVLKRGKVCAILIGDTRRKKHYVPISTRTMLAFLDVGFALVEDIIKVQHKCQSTPYWRKKSKEWNFHLIMHEHLFVFRKPETEKQRKRLKDSIRWW